jgi:hypothetical protein
MAGAWPDASMWPPAPRESGSHPFAGAQLRGTNAGIDGARSYEVMSLAPAKSTQALLLPYAPERALANDFELTLRPGGRVMARWKLLELRISAPALVIRLDEDCALVSYGADEDGLATRWLPLSNAPDWTPDHGVFPMLFQCG